jgi:hypothetical protein
METKATATLIVKSENVILFQRVIDKDAGYSLFNNFFTNYTSATPSKDRIDTIELYRNFSAMSTKMLSLELYIYPGQTEKLIDMLLKLYP